jgi:flagellar hook protein FlgE
MMRALFAGVSGLRNHQTRLDVIGNNIANVNTVAFKSARVTFEEAFSQLLRGATRPTATTGGLNPIQIGLGMNIGSVDHSFAQGNLESTGNPMDLAIQGNAFLIAREGNTQLYTRLGNLQLDGSGKLVLPNSGSAIQGIMADQAGVLPTGTALTDIDIPIGQTSPARATTSVSLAGNLDSSEDPLGTILTTAGRLYAIERSTSNGGVGTDMKRLFANGNANADIAGMTAGNTTVTVSDGTTTRTYTYVAQDLGVGDASFNSLNDLIGEINNDFTGQLTAALNGANGSLDVTANAAGITLSLSSSSATLQSALSSANGALANGSTASTDEFSHVAVSSDVLVDLRDQTGTSLGLGGGDVILLDGAVGGTAVTQGSLTVAGGTTYQDLQTALSTTLGIVNGSGTNTDANTGALHIAGDGGTAFALSGLNVRVQGGGAPAFDAVFGSQAGNYIEQQIATDVQHQVSIGVFDSLGDEHVLTFTFTKDPTSPNQWTWQANAPSPATVTAGGTGTVTFDENGRLQAFAYDGGASAIQLDPSNGAAAAVTIAVDPGTLGDLNGLSQFAAPSNAVASGQDGYAAGNLQEFAIDETGTVTGFFTNGLSRVLAQIAVAQFTNPTGLLHRGDNMYEESGNSGIPLVGFVGTSNNSRITPGALEGSNVDLSREFTDMIIAQRGFQANARIITTADEMLTELVNLKR